MIVKVKTLTGKDIVVDVSADAKVIDLKKSIECKEHISVQQQKIVHRGRILSNDEDNLKDHGFVNETVVHMVIALRGG